MSCPPSSDSSTVPVTCDQRLELHFSEIKKHLNDLIYKEQVNQLWKFGVESSLYSILNKVSSDTQRECVSTSSQTDDQLEKDCDTFLKSSIHRNETSRTHQKEDKSIILTAEKKNELNPEELQKEVEAISSTSSSNYEKKMSPSGVTPEQPTKCAIESRSYAVQAFYRCNCCESTFSRKDELLLHERTHVKPGASSLKCGICSQVCTSRRALGKHRRFCSDLQKEHVHVNESRQTIQEEDKNVVLNAEEDNEFHIEEQQDVVEPIPSCSLSNENEMSTSVASPESPTKRARSEQSKFYQCSHCESKFSRKDEMSLHERTHEEAVTPSSKCNTCSRVFTSLGNFAKHRRVCFNQQKSTCSFTCAVCGESFPTKEKLHTHSWHHKEKKHKCTVCGHAFYKPVHLVAHMVTHTGVRPFRCELCPKSFSKPGTRAFHVRKYHTN